MPIWVNYPNLPLNCWSMDLLSRISSYLGIPLYVDECTTKVDRISFARVLIEMDVARELPKKIKVKDPNGRTFEQSVQYEWVPEYCSKCMQIGHKMPGKGGTKTKSRPKASGQMVQKKTNDGQLDKGSRQNELEHGAKSKEMQTNEEIETGYRLVLKRQQEMVQVHRIGHML